MFDMLVKRKNHLGNAVGCLMYLIVSTRPSISHADNVINRFMVDLVEEHWNAEK